MAVPYTFANTPNGQTIPLSQLDANFTYVENQIAAGTGVVSLSGGNTGLTPNTPTTGAITLGGTLSVANGGTGGSTPNAAMLNLLPSQSGNANKVLTTDGNGNLSWTTAGGGGGGVSSVTSTLSGVTATPTTGAVNIGGVLGVASGGTGVSIAPGVGQLLVGTGTGFALNTLQQGSGISITNAAGVITINATGGGGGGTVTNFSTTLTGLSVATATSTPVLSGTLGIASGGTGLSAIGANGTVLTSNGTSASWATVSATVATGNYGAISVTSPSVWAINPGVVTPLMLSTGGPSWASNGNLQVSGSVGIGTAPTSYALTVVATGAFEAINATATASSAIVGTGTVSGVFGATASGYYGNIGCNVAGTNYSFYGNSNLLAQGVPSNGIGGGTAAYFSAGGMFGFNSSTREVKTNIEPLTDVAWLLQLEPVSFNYRLKDEEGNYTDNFEQEVSVGLIADDVVNIKKELVFYRNDENDQQKLAGVHYDRLVTPILKMLQNIEARLAKLEAK
jgi:hypothetical protein